MIPAPVIVLRSTDGRASLLCGCSHSLSPLFPVTIIMPHSNNKKQKNKQKANRKIQRHRDLTENRVCADAMSDAMFAAMGGRVVGLVGVWWVCCAGGRLLHLMVCGSVPELPASKPITVPVRLSAGQQSQKPLERLSAATVVPGFEPGIQIHHHSCHRQPTIIFVGSPAGATSSATPAVVLKAHRCR